ncbi:MAG: hypothetical protein C9356_10000 [Oleiphilus sp.]|nr:MAG: hypothetical protein C9356_10000 [Oleiphilus sp.]
MTGISAKEPSGLTVDQIDNAPDNEYIRLRKLLLGPEYEQAIKDYISRQSDAERVAAVLSQAIEAASSRDTALGKALAPVLNKAIHESISRNPSQITTVMSPIMGPSIRKAVATALSDMVQSLNKVLEQSLSIRGLFWRIKAWRAGVSYGRYVMSQTLRFAVEQVLLVHRETGLLLHSVVSETTDTKDPELVSSMLTAIQDFVADSFDTASGADLDKVQVGDLTLHLISGGNSVLAFATRGTIGPAAMEQIIGHYETLQQEFTEEIAGFSGNRDAFNGAEDHLKSCLLSEQLVPKTSRQQRPWLAIAVLFMLGLALVYNGYLGTLRTLEYERIVEALSSQGDYMLISHRIEDEHITAQMLRSVSGIPPEQLIRNIEPAFYDLQLDVRALTFGEIDVDKLNALELPTPAPEPTLLEKFNALAGLIQSQSLYFEKGTANLSGQSIETFQTLVSKLKNVSEIAEVLKPGQLQIMVQGYSDRVGSRINNLALSKERAEHVRDMLISNGLSADTVIAWGLGYRDLGVEDLEWQRRVAIQVLLPGVSINLSNSNASKLGMQR